MLIDNYKRTSTIFLKRCHLVKCLDIGNSQLSQNVADNSFLVVLVISDFEGEEQSKVNLFEPLGDEEFGPPPIVGLRNESIAWSST